MPRLMPLLWPPISIPMISRNRCAMAEAAWVPRLGRKAAFVGQVAQILIHVCDPQFTWLAIAVEVQKPANPSEIRLFGPRAPLPCPHFSGQAGGSGGRADWE